ncbi:mini zinc finger protein 2-like [Daucus carota subsp. sativus]|nr:PREDICTED: mini zinc finger protein 2-like [Daucus carota subsp. sativus]
MPSAQTDKHQETECWGATILEDFGGAEESVTMKKVVRKDDSNNNGSHTNSSSTVTRVTYGECQKNHAANIGGYAVDGCREFLASGEEGTEAAFTCACCGCHRSFHRREVQTEVVSDSSSSN